jgi:hypothetical protein
MRSFVGLEMTDIINPPIDVALLETGAFNGLEVIAVYKEVPDNRPAGCYFSVNGLIEKLVSGRR